MSPRRFLLQVRHLPKPSRDLMSRRKQMRAMMAATTHIDARAMDGAPSISSV